MKEKKLKQEFHDWFSTEAHVDEYTDVAHIEFARAAYVYAAAKRDNLIKELLMDLQDAYKKHHLHSIRKAEIMGYEA
jgi:2-phospho-L-lactate guanylyltransferase (CobY/MobA/RfbA family)